MTSITGKFALVLSVCLLLGACGGSGGSAEGEGGDAADGADASSFTEPFQDAAAYPLFVNSEIVVGRNRILIGVLNDNDAPIGSPELDVSVDIFDLEKSSTEAVAQMPTEFVWSIEDVTGVYVGEATFDHAGTWGARVTITGEDVDETLKTSIDVKETGSTPALGSEVPASDTLTLGDKPLDELTTDPHPDKDMYETSIADAVAAGEPFVVTFATPKFCTSAVCGPTLDLVKEVAKQHPGMTFIHVEVYELPADPSNLVPVPSVGEWGLPSEPWVFVVGSNGELVAKYEGIVGREELGEQLDSL